MVGQHRHPTFLAFSIPNDQRSRVAVDPSQPNLGQFNIIHAELHDELRKAGFVVTAGQMGENITTRGMDLLGLPRGYTVASR